MAKSLSKSRFLAGLQCEKRLWFETHVRATKPPELDPQVEFILRQGTEVGVLARRLFPAGKLIGASFLEPALALKQTAQAVKEGAKVLFEAAAEGGGAFARADILVWKGAASNWDILEVKTSGYREEGELAEEKDQFLWDLAVQRHAFEQGGFKIGKVSLVLIDSDFVRKGPVDPAGFFKTEDVSKEVSLRLGEVPKHLERLSKTVTVAKNPKVEIGAHCSLPYTCPYIDTCWPDESADHVFKFRGMRWDKKLAHYFAGRTHFKHFKNEKLTDWQAKQLEAQKTGQVLVDKPKLKAFLKGLEYPLFHLDFETANPAIPPFNGARPFRQTVFQYSLHVEAKSGVAPKHFEFLPNDQQDPRAKFIDSLLEYLGSTGTILAYNASFEMGRLKDLAELFPKQRKRIETVIARFQDLMTPFAKGWFVHPGFRGSTSIKAVLPALVPSMTYEGMEVGDGSAAIRAYMEFLQPETSTVRRQAIRRNLLAYCGQDTLAMVKILGVLRTSVI